MNPINQRLVSALEPPPLLTCSDWANEFRYLSKESSAQANKYRTSTAPYQKEVMDAVNDDAVQTICCMFASQTGKTEMLNNMVGYFMDCDPAPILVVQPTIEFAESWSKERLVPMLRDCPCFEGKVKDPRSRDSGNTILAKSFLGGNIAIVGANAPAGLAGRPRRVVLLDEVDRFPRSAGTEGDPCALAIRRTESFYNSVIVLTSTPTLKGLSRIEAEFEQTDKRYWHCPCPHCGEWQTLRWQNVTWPEDKPEEATLQCEKCLAKIDDSQRVRMIKQGEWRATAQFNGKRGYHLNGIYSPFKCKRGYKNRLHQMAAQFLEAKHGGEETLKAWVNTFLAETWEAAGDKIDSTDIAARREDYATMPPKDVLVMTWAADVQGDRIEAEIVGWGVGEENWGIKRGYFLGDPNTSADVWRQLADFANTEFQHPTYGKMKPQIGMVDSGYATAQAYAFVRRMSPAQVYAIKGAKTRLKSPVEAPKRKSRSNALLVDTQEFKTSIYSRMKITEPGARFMHFPKDYDDEFFAQLTAEKVVTKWIKGEKYQLWENTRSNRRNEALDIRVYNHAALFLLNPNWEKLAENLKARATAREYILKPPEVKPETVATMQAETPKPNPPERREPRKAIWPKRRPGGFVGGWR
jgi:phage terminase large subunit GpA-like protein